jgi:hypothetical protein
VHIDGTPEKQLLSFTAVSLVSRTFAPCPSPSCSGTVSLRLFFSTFDVHRGLSSKTTLTMLLRRLSQRLHSAKGPLITHTSTNHQPRPSPPSSKRQNTQPSEIPLKRNSTNQPMHPPPRQGPAKTATLPAQAKPTEGIRVNHPHGHLHHYTCYQ